MYFSNFAKKSTKRGRSETRLRSQHARRSTEKSLRYSTACIGARRVGYIGESGSARGSAQPQRLPYAAFYGYFLGGTRK